jgi:cytochrome P450 family 9
MIADPDLIKKIMIRDFDHFVNRDANENNLIGDKYFGRSVLQLRDHKWKEMRQLLSPIYTTSKLKMMFNLMLESAEEFSNNLKEKSKMNNDVIEIDTRDVFARVTADGIATTALGFKGDCITNKNSQMFQIAADIGSDFANAGKMMLLYFLPKIYGFLGLQQFRKSIHDFFEKNILDEMKRRREEKISRPDVIQMLVQAKEGQLKHEKGDEVEEISVESTSKIKKNNWTDEDLVAQAFIFFIGGFETTTTVLQGLAFELAKNMDVQEKLIEEIDEMNEMLDGKLISVEQLNQMKYLEMVINEALRKWPAFHGIARHCTKDYELKDDETGKSWKIKKGIDILVPFDSMCRDERFFSNPEKFDPERFNDENKKSTWNAIFIPFGLGPRMCIGSRYALIELKLITYKLLSNFKVYENSKTPTKLTLSKGISGYVEDVFVDLKYRK